MIYIFWTCADEEEAREIVKGLLDKRLIACASWIPGVTSLYRWEGKIEESEEVKVILKSQEELFKKIVNYIQDHCSYEVPEIVQVDIARGSREYLAWIDKETE